MAGNLNESKKTLYGALAGLAAYAIVGSLGLFLLLKCWPGYAIASKDKSYTFKMLLLRLLVGTLAIIFASVVATKIPNGKKKSAWLVGTIVCCVAAYIHFFRVWADYPVWYHVAYLFPILPITGLSLYVIAKRR
jgi:hypothetical protein